MPAIRALISQQIMAGITMLKMFDENIAMAGRLGRAGCEVLLKIYPGTVHGFLEAESIVGSKLAKSALEDLGKFVSCQSGAATQ